MKLERIKRRSVVEEIISQIQASIQNEELQPGDRLPGERELAERFGVSRASVREALRALALNGIVHIKHGDGAYLVKGVGTLFSGVMKSKLGFLVEKSDLIQLMEARVILEVELAKLAAERATEEDLQEMYNSIKRMEEAFDDEEVYVKENVAFHIAVSEVAKNSILYESIKAIRELLVNAQEAIANSVGLREHSVKYHWEIYEAIKNSDAERAGSAMREHLASVQKAIADYVERCSHS